MNEQKEFPKTQTISKKIISTLMSVCTAFPKPKNDLSFEEWQRIEFRQPRSEESTKRSYYL